MSIPAGLQCVLFIPEATCETADARRVVPKTLSREDAIFNAGRTALLVHALATNQLDDLLNATQDRCGLRTSAFYLIKPALTVVLVLVLAHPRTRAPARSARPQVAPAVPRSLDALPVSAHRGRHQSWRFVAPRDATVTGSASDTPARA